ncbi:MBL fold metallo-hydrolase [Candidatus Woesearchaeota archaeon]|nr:MBL fold metallo-hydrolase [Candidatus Woesearchaeota archaeon]
MGDRIVFLGSGGDSIVIGKQYRGSGGIILQVEDNQFHIDPGPGSLVMARMYGINLRENTAVFVSHNHINHAGGANEVISAMTHNGLDKKGVLVGNNSSINGTSENEPFIHNFYKRCVERYIALDPDSKVGINHIDIKLTETKHLDENGVGFKFFAPKFTMGYTSDTEFTNEIADQYKNTDILILCVISPRNTKQKGSLNTDDAIKFIERAKPKLAIITHFGIKMLQADPIYEAREIQKQSQAQVIAAKDGLVINPVSFSSSVRQKTLKNY